LAGYPVDPARTLLIGDKDTDITAAKAAGVEGLLFEGGSVWAALSPVLPRLIG
jgi:D-glycero-D-manno-heptose 1,7-bisphosphate phosphatase